MPSLTKGYWSGGFTSGVTIVNEIDGIDFASDTGVNPTAALTQGRQDHACVSYNYVAITGRGYFSGGGQDSTRIDGIDFAQEVALYLTAALGTGRVTAMGVSSATSGYTCGGINTQTTGLNYNLIDKLIFSIESNSVLSATLALARNGGAGVQSATKGYIAGGLSNSINGVQEIDGIDFTTNAAINPSTAVTGGYYQAGTSSSLAGYIHIGRTTGGSDTTQVDKLTFASESIAQNSGTLSYARFGSTGVQSPTRGYYAGSTGANVSIDGIRYDTDAGITTSAVLAQTRAYSGGASSLTKGYFTRLSSPFDGIIFATETSLTSSVTLTLNRSGVASMGYNKG